MRFTGPVYYDYGWVVAWAVQAGTRRNAVRVRTRTQKRCPFKFKVIAIRALRGWVRRRATVRSRGPRRARAVIN